MYVQERGIRSALERSTTRRSLGIDDLCATCAIIIPHRSLTTAYTAVVVEEALAISKHAMMQTSVGSCHIMTAGLVEQQPYTMHAYVPDIPSCLLLFTAE